MKCNYCPGKCIKKGFYKNVQRYLCKGCQKYQQSAYCYRKYDEATGRQITILNNEGMGISSISRVLSIPKTTVQRRLYLVSLQVQPPDVVERGQQYDIDELHTYIGKNDLSCYTYITYAINRISGRVIDYVIGARSKKNIGRLVNKVMALNPKRIYTDKLNIFGYLIPSAVHRTFQYKTNRIERKNLTLRTHLKRLARKTICFSMSVKMLEASLRLYLWRGTKSFELLRR